MKSHRRALLLRTFADRDADRRDIALLALAIKDHATLVLVGEEEENQRLRAALLTLLPEFANGEGIELVNSNEEDWERTVIDQILRADLILIRFTPKSMKFPEIPPPTGAVVSMLEFYQISPIQPRTGRGLLFELSLCNRLEALSRTVLLLNDTQTNEVAGFVRMATIAHGGDVFTGAMRPPMPRLTGLDKQIGHLRHVAHSLAFPARDFEDFHDPLSLEMQEAIRAAALDIIDNESANYVGVDRTAQNYLDFGVSDQPRRVFPDYEEKVVRYTPVETLLFIPPGNLIEMSYKDVVEDFGLIDERAECPYCQARSPSLFLYQHGHTVDRRGAIRCKCQQCGRRSTLIDGILLDM